MRYAIEEFEVQYFGQDCLLSCEVDIEYTTTPAEPDVGYNGSVEIKDIDIVSPVLLVMDNDEEHEFVTQELKDGFKSKILADYNWSHAKELIAEEVA